MNGKTCCRYFSGTRRKRESSQEQLSLYEIVSRCQNKEYQQILEKTRNPEILFHLSPMRKFLLEWFRMEPGKKVLQLGAGAGGLTELFLEKGALVDGIEPVEILARCNEKRNYHHANLSLYCGYLSSALEEWEKLKKESYDFVVITEGVTDPHGLMGRESSQKEMLEILQEYLAPQGKLILAVENRMGLKYWAGCVEEFTGKYFSGIQGDSGKEEGPRTKQELEELLKYTGYEELKFYYPYPDAEFPTMIYSDSYLPRHGELRTNIRNYKEKRFSFFDESKVYDTLLSQKLYPQYANAFLVIAGKGSK